jgi:hypothetical protein
MLLERKISSRKLGLPVQQLEGEQCIKRARFAETMGKRQLKGGGGLHAPTHHCGQAHTTEIHKPNRLGWHVQPKQGLQQKGTRSHRLLNIDLLTATEGIRIGQKQGSLKRLPRLVVNLDHLDPCVT